MEYDVIVNDYPGKGTKVLLKTNYFEVYVNRACCGIEREKAVRSAFSDWFSRKAAGLIYERVEFYKAIIGVKYNRIGIKSQKTRWGSCSSKGNLNFNWRLAMAPEWIMDYVIIHELCHLIHMNHSKEFWGTVASYMPDYEKAIIWLKENGGKLKITDLEGKAWIAEK
ncbi:MAG: M48 family metallopeptidase [Caulobacteraceae bacterium]